MLLKPLEKIIQLLGGNQQDLADALNLVLAPDEKPITQAHVWKWLNTTLDGIPAKHVINACKAVGYQVIPHELRPDLYPHPDDGLPDDLRAAA